MGFLWDCSKIIVVTITILGLALNSYLSPVVAAVFMMLYVMFRGAVRGSGGITKALFWVFEIAFILSLFANVLAKGGGIVNLILLIFKLFGTAVTWVIELILRGYIGILHAIIFIAAIIILENLGKHIGNFGVHAAARKAFLIGVPIAMIIVFAIVYGEDNVSALLGQLLPLLLLLFGFYVMFFGWSSSRRRH